ncbi:MAG: hemerythrin domain-containing protein [Candidatus Nitrosotenuis sp.]
MSTESLRKDHLLIEKVLKSMQVTLELLRSGKKIPESILVPVVDFSKNFTDVCHHGKEEESLFPALERAGMPRHMGPIAVMLMEHQVTKQIAQRMDVSSKEYLRSGSSEQLVRDISDYIEHVSAHLWKENNRLFVMAEMRLQGLTEEITAQLDDVESKKLIQLGKTRADYEKMTDELEQNISKLN